MDFVTVVVAYLVLAAALICVMLFGGLPALQGTPISALHWGVTEGICLALEAAVLRCCGQRGVQWVETLLERCCDRPSHFLQISYVLLVGVGVWLYQLNIFSLLPNARAGLINQWIGWALIVASGVSFVVACRSDPGAITPATLPAHTTLYPLDGRLWKAKTCVTCGWSRPARSKHCRVCACCVARHDHHCGWINNCVGLGNHRLFLLFLLTNLSMTTFGAWLGCRCLLAQVQRVGLLGHRVMDYRTGRVMTVSAPWRRAVEWTAIWFPIGCALTLFLAASSLLLLCFLGYQLALICQGKTQYEVHRLTLLDAAGEQSGADEHGTLGTVPSAAQAAPGGGGGVNQRKGKRAKGAAVTGVEGPALPRVGGKQRHPFDRGWLRNLSEVFFPHYHLERAAKAAACG